MWPERSRARRGCAAKPCFDSFGPRDGSAALKGSGTLPRASVASSIFANGYNIPMTAAQSETANVFSLVAFPPSLTKTRVWGPGLEKHAFIGPSGGVGSTLHWGCGYIYGGKASGSTDQRYYASGYGRFNTADPIKSSAGPNDPGSWNRSAYVQGDPVNFGDPTGLLCVRRD